MTEEGLFEPDLGFFGGIREAFFGKTETDFEVRARELAMGRKQGHKQGRRYGSKNKRLGQDNFATILRNDDGFMWTGEIYMGKLSKMDVVYDTGSDWLVIEG